MKKILSPLLFISIMLCVSMVAMAQDFPSLREKAENVVKSRRPEWKLVRKEEKEKQVSYQYGTVDDGVNLRIFYGTSQEEAAEKMKASLKFLSVGPGKKRNDIGDEAYSWKSEGNGSAGIRFRKANVYIELAATSVAIVEDLARKLAELVPKK
jgi:hypothetical protein